MFKKVIIFGAGGFIGHHLARKLKDEGNYVIGVDINYSFYCDDKDYDNKIVGDARDKAFVNSIIEDDIDEIYQLAANMGGMGFISVEHADIMHDNVLMNANIANAARDKDVKVFFSSSACIYPEFLQDDLDKEVELKEENAYPAQPDKEYGWEKLFSEILYEAFGKDYDLNYRIARFHNVYGPEGEYEGGREKAPAALCRKVIKADEDITIWGDGKQMRSFCYIDDCLNKIEILMGNDFKGPINIGSEYIVTIDELVDIISNIEGKELKKNHDLDKPQGVRKRNSDNTLWEEKFGEYDEISLSKGLKKTYNWIKEQL